MHFLQKKYKDLSSPNSGCNLAGAFDLIGIRHDLATKSLTEKLHIYIKNKSTKANQSLVTLLLTDEKLHTVVELATVSCNDICHASLMLVNKLQCQLSLRAGVSCSVAPIINCHSHLRIKR
jgi:hypothetical protein